MAAAIGALGNTAGNSLSSLLFIPDENWPEASLSELRQAGVESPCEGAFSPECW